MSAAKGTGRPRIPAWQSLVAQPAGVEDLTAAKLIDVGLLEPNPYQPRRTFDARALDELAASIRVDGVLQPLSVRPHPTQGGRYQIVAGERRWRAARVAGLTQVPCIERTMDDDAMERLALVENVQRTDLDPVDEAHAYKRLMDRLGLSVRDVAASVHKDHSYVAGRLLLIKYSAIEEQVSAGSIGPTVATEIARIADDERRDELVGRVKRGERVSVDDAKGARRPKQAVATPEPPPATEATRLATSPLVGNIPHDDPDDASDTPPAVGNIPHGKRQEPPVDGLQAVLGALDVGALDALLDYGIALAWSCQELARAVRERRATPPA